MTRDEIQALLIDGLHETFNIDRARITLDADLFTDLDLDSIDAVDLAVKLQQATGRRLAPEQFRSLRTVRDVIDAIEGMDVA